MYLAVGKCLTNEQISSTNFNGKWIWWLLECEVIIKEFWSENTNRWSLLLHSVGSKHGILAPGFRQWAWNRALVLLATIEWSQILGLNRNLFRSSFYTCRCNCCKCHGLQNSITSIFFSIQSNKSVIWPHWGGGGGWSLYAPNFFFGKMCMSYDYSTVVQ